MAMKEPTAEDAALQVAADTMSRLVKRFTALGHGRDEAVAMARSILDLAMETAQKQKAASASGTGA